jgi:hypothetical protein
MAQAAKDCPVCGAAMPASERYPNAICDRHVNECFDTDGNPVIHENTAAWGGFVSRHDVNGVMIDRSDPLCYVRDKKCHAAVHRFGGIVVQLVITDDECAG